MKESPPPLIIAIVLLLLPVLYVGSYLALVVPEGRGYVESPGVVGPVYISHYRIGFSVPAIIFWPLEQIDRKVRPGIWGGLRDLNSDGIPRLIPANPATST